MILPYSQFEECIFLLTTPIENLSLHDPNHSALLGSRDEITEFYIKYFSEELEEKILTKVNHEQKEDLIRYYLSKLMKSINHLPDNNNLPEFETSDQDKDGKENLSDNIRTGGLLIMDFPNRQKNRQRFSKGCQSLYHLMVDEIQKSCIIYKIPFFTLCKELNFSLEGINIEIILEYERARNLVTSDEEDNQPSFPVIHPIFKPESVDQIFEILKVFFSQEDQTELQSMLQNGKNTTKPLLFLDTGNRLADAFKQLYDSDIITGCQKKELESWIGQNFQYRYRGVSLNFKPRYLSDIISTTKDKCQKPIINIIKEKTTGNLLIRKV